MNSRWTNGGAVCAARNLFEKKKQMKTTNEKTAAKPAAATSTIARRPPAKDRAQRWMPQPCGISRDDMRRIVIEMIG
jgi:hypothetical protein